YSSSPSTTPPPLSTLSLHDALPISRVGVIYLPALGEMIAAADGLGCTWNGRPCRVSSVASLSDAVVCTSSVTSCERRAPEIWKRSEEHTSELQSRSDLVCRLLLEKK